MRKTGIAVGALMAFSLAVAATPASALPCDEESGVATICGPVANVLEPFTVGTIKFTSVTEEEIALEVPGLGLRILCKKAPGSGSFVQGELLVVALTGKIKQTFEGCAAQPPNNGCTVENFSIEAKISFPSVEPVPAAVNLKPAGEVFGKITLSGAGCLIAGKSDIAGEITCHAPTSLSDTRAHLVECTHTDKGLTFAKKPATMEIKSQITLENGPEWSIDLY